ncbi:hypothetical protein NDU88_002919 [Pleurodeles waltl]|uniref:Uncharacterized protein n=1 Tax=Pleurodeles waltl TaxID=8319 RepID=A0AAV7W0N7_PLEWA|nr:hypothetical protein NDU88_002919 [Pleurodeles waltl]
MAVGPSRAAYPQWKDRGECERRGSRRKDNPETGCTRSVPGTGETLRRHSGVPLVAEKILSDYQRLVLQESIGAALVDPTSPPTGENLPGEGTGVC